MFKDTEKIMVMIQGAYRKLKSYYYYNKNFMIMREKISSFEDDRDAMYATFEKFAETLCHPIKMREYTAMRTLDLCYLKEMHCCKL